MSNATCAVNACTKPIKARGWCHMHYVRWHRTGSIETIPSQGVEVRFWAKVKKTPTCWEWQAALVKGYGHFFTKEGGKVKTHKAHRMAYEMLVGPIPENHDLDHVCHNEACVNPAHLRPTTRKQNAENRSGPNINSKSGYRGVHWKSNVRKWCVVVGHNGKHHYGGYFSDRHEAGRAAQRMRLQLFTHSDADR